MGVPLSKPPPHASGHGGLQQGYLCRNINYVGNGAYTWSNERTAVKPHAPLLEIRCLGASWYALRDCTRTKIFRVDQHPTRLRMTSGMTPGMTRLSENPMSRPTSSKSLEHRGALAPACATQPVWIAIIPLSPDVPEPDFVVRGRARAGYLFQRCIFARLARLKMRPTCEG